MSRRSPRPPGAARQRIAFRNRSALHAAASRLFDDPLVESCAVDVPNLLVEVGLAAHVVARQQAVADWRRRFESRVRGLVPGAG